MKFLNKIQNKGIERIVRDRLAKYATESGVSVNFEKIQVTFSDDDYGVEIHYKARNEGQKQSFERMLDEDPYLRGHFRFYI